MNHGAKALIPVLSACVGLFALASCDRGVASCADGDSTCVTLGDVSTTPTGNGGTGNGGTKNDTNTTVDPGSSGSGRDPVYDTGAAIKSIAKADYAGVPNILGGDARLIAFHVVDSTLHITASSDGLSLATSKSNRETIYELQIFCTDSIQFGWDSKTDNGLAPSFYTGVDPITATEPHPLSVTVLRMPVITKALMAHLTARRGSEFWVWVKARSGQVLKGNAVVVPEDSLPSLDLAETKALLVSGISLKAIPSDPFRLQVP